MSSLFSINAGENLELNFDIYAFPGGDTWHGQYDNSRAYLIGDVVVPTISIASQRNASVAVLRAAPGTQEIAYRCVASSTGNPPPNTNFWTPLMAISAANVETVFLEFLTAGGKPVQSWLYRWGAPLRVGLLDGLIKFELTADNSAQLATGTYGLELSIALLDTGFVATGAQTDVLPFPVDVIAVTAASWSSSG